MPNEKKYPKVAVGVAIFNKDGQVFLIRSPAWNNLLVMPGGHIEWGESAQDAVAREVMEEVGLKITNLRFVRPVEILNDVNYNKKDADGEPRHIVALDYAADIENGEQIVTLDGLEAVDSMWLSIDDILKRDDIEPLSKETILLASGSSHKDKKSIFSRECKKCPDTKKECEEYKSGWQRALADYKNLQTETDKRRGEWAKMSEAQILEEFIPVYDNFKKAFAVEGKTADSWAQGIEYIKKQFADILSAHGVEEIKTVGEKFDPTKHEAVGDEEVEDKEHGEILKEISGGYMAHGKVLRAARVIISK